MFICCTCTTCFVQNEKCSVLEMSTLIILIVAIWNILLALGSYAYASSKMGN